MYDEAIADTDANQRPGKAAIVCPRLNRPSRCDLDTSDARVKIELYDSWVGIRVGGLDGLYIHIPLLGLRMPLTCRVVGQAQSQDERETDTQKKGSARS